MVKKERRYHKELQLEIEWATTNPTAASEIDGSDAEVDLDLKQIAKDEDSMSKTAMTRKKRKLLDAMEVRSPITLHLLFIFKY